MFGANPYQNNTIYMNEAIANVFGGVLVAVVVVAVVICLGLFVFRAMSLCKIARRRGISNVWLAWVPVCGEWILGSVADQYQYVVKGRVKNRRLPLFLLSAAALGLWIAGSALTVSTLTYVLRFMLTGVGYPEAGRLALMILVSALQAVVTVVYLVIRCFVMYDVYSSCTSRHNVLLLVLGQIFPVLEPVFFFVCRNKEEGMPPRREVPPSEEPEVTAQA